MSEQASTTAAPTGTKIILHWLEKSRAQRILFLLEELSVPYQIKTYKRTKDGLGPPELKQVHPLGKSPLLEVQVPGRKSIVLAESALIVEYLCDYYGKHLIPKRFDAGEEGIGMESEAWLRYKYYMNYAEGSLMPYLVMKLVMNKIENSPVPFFIKPVTRSIASNVNSSFIHPNLQTNFDFMESQLASSPHKGQYFCGDMSAADFLLIFPVEAGTTRLPGISDKTHPNLFAWVKRMQERDSWKRGVDRIIKETGSYDATL